METETNILPAEATRKRIDNSLNGAKIGVMIEADYYEAEIWYYQHRFQEEGVDLRWLTRLWGQPNIVFQGHEYHAPLTIPEESVEPAHLTPDVLATYDAIIVPSAFVSDRLRYTEDVKVLPPATQTLVNAFANKEIVKGIICHGLWLCASVPELVRGRSLVCHNNLHGDAINMGAKYVDQDVVHDGDLITGRTGAHCHLFARAILDEVARRRAARAQRAEAAA